MKIQILCFVSLWILTACGQNNSPLTGPQDAYTILTMTPTQTGDTASNVTPTPVPSGAETVGLTFFKAWEKQDYGVMYAQLTPQSQALVNYETFVKRYQDAIETAHVTDIYVQPVASRQEDEQAEFSVRVTWESPLVDNVVRTHLVKLVYDANRWGIVWQEGLILPELAGGNRLVMDYKVPARGNIYDRDGLALAYQGAIITLGVIPGRMEDEAGLLAAVSPLLGKSPADIQALYASALPDWYVPLGDISTTVMQNNLTTLEPFLNRGLVSNESLGRIYPDGGIAPHVVGYTTEIPAERLAEYRLLGYQGTETVGRVGLEAWGERYLGGTRGGTLSVVDNSGNVLHVLQQTDSKQSRAVYTSFQKTFQKNVEEALETAILNHPIAGAGSVVVLDVNTGAVLALANYPTYDAGIFDTSRSDLADELNRALQDPGRPLLNRAVQGQLPPGSVFKIVTMAAGLNSGEYSYNSTYSSTGSWNKLGENLIKYDWDTNGHGFVTYAQALMVSCNTCFYDMAYRLDQIDSYLLPNIARQFGLGSAIGVQGLAAGTEATGIIPDPQWKLNHGDGGWVPGDSVNMGIGQGYVLVTPMQIANMMAAIANGGTLYQPSLVDRIGGGGGAPEEKLSPRVLGSLPLTSEQLFDMRSALRQVVASVNGTAYFQLGDLQVPVAGKTGTAQNLGFHPHAWFTGYAPAAPYTTLGGTALNQPEIAIAVVVENAGEGSAVAAPIFRRVVELYYGITPLTPYPWGG